MTTMFKASTADRTRWQRRAIDGLNEIWAKGAKAGLPVLMWQVGANGIAGTACDHDPAERLANIHAWAKLLKVELREVTVGDGTRRLVGFAENYGKAGVDFSLAADILDD